jgi:hypothetical protein
MFTLRHPATTLIDRQKLNGKSIGTLNQLLTYLTTNATGSIGNLMLGSHASDSALVLPGGGKEPRDAVVYNSQMVPMTETIVWRTETVASRSYAWW